MTKDIDETECFWRRKGDIMYCDIHQHRRALMYAR